MFFIQQFGSNAGAGNYVPWHQDATYFGPYEHVTAWVALTDSTLENGCVEVLPGSHNSGQKPHRDNRDELAMLSRGQTLSINLDKVQACRLSLGRRCFISPHVIDASFRT